MSNWFSQVRQLDCSIMITKSINILILTPIILSSIAIGFHRRGSFSLLGIRRLLRFPLLLRCSRLLRVFIVILIIIIIIIHALSPTFHYYHLHLIKLGLVCRLDLSPHLAEDLRHLADARVRVLLPHLQQHHHYKEGGGRSGWSPTASPSSSLTI